MERNKKIAGAHVALLLLTAAFLASLAWMALRGEAPAAELDGFAVSVERSVPAALLAAPERELVNLNTATAEELATLTGIGPVLAQRIVDYRVEHGAFASADELMEVDGVGRAKLDAIRDEITLEEGGSP